MPIVAGCGLNLTSITPGDLNGAANLMARWAEIGCSHVEISARRLDIIVGGQLNMPAVRRLAGIIDQHGMAPVLHAPHGINLMDRARRDMHKAAAEASIEFCRITGCASMVLHSGHVSAQEWVVQRDVLLAEEQNQLRRLGDLAEKAGVNIAVENLIASPLNADRIIYGADPRALATQLAAVDHPRVGACLDFGHAFLSSSMLGFDFIDACATLSPQVWHLHLHDNFGDPSGGAGIGDSGDAAVMGQGDMHAPIFWGAIPWAELLPRMQFRQGTFGMIELNGRYNAYAEGVLQSARNVAAHLDGAPLVNPWEQSV
ncbi:sugar phosphate isomerase/epimerase family protein [Pacificibacter sp. AS14]|uniref:sugar phosphate isomerase/epimerase family protein n=1 Tax=Pacificibacter sp. AS14 TaxID=3135785 RepID=UPI00316D1D42